MGPEKIKAVLEKNKELELLVARLTCEKNEQGHKIELLQEQLNDLLRRLHGRKSERFERPDQPDFFDSLLELPEAPAARAEEPKLEAISYTRRQPQKRGPRPLPEHLERVVVYLDIPENDRGCSFCSQQMEVVDEVVREELEVEPPRFRVRQYVQRRRRCRPCMNRDVFVPFPPRLIPNGRPSSTLLAYLVVSKYVDHLPLYRQEGIFKRQGISLSRKTMDEWLGQLSGLLLPIIAAMWRRLLENESYLQVDETPIDAFEPIPQNKGKRGKKQKRIRKSYLWVYSVPGGEVLYDVTPSRSGRAPVERLAGFRGTVQTDGYSGYNELFRSGRCRRLACMAHARRKLKEARHAAPEQIDEILTLIGALYDIEAEARSQDLQAQARKQLRESRQAAKILEKVKAKIDELAPVPTPSSKLGKAIAYAQSQWPFLERYLEDGAFEIDNNICENAIRPAAVGRRNYLFLGSVEGGGQRASVFYTLVESAKRLGIDPFEYLCDVFERLPTTDETRLDELTPAAYLAARRAAENAPV